MFDVLTGGLSSLSTTFWLWVALGWRASFYMPVLRSAWSEYLMRGCLFGHIFTLRNHLTDLDYILPKIHARPLTIHPLQETQFRLKNKYNFLFPSCI
jgi:hypothetical protein